MKASSNHQGIKCKVTWRSILYCGKKNSYMVKNTALAALKAIETEMNTGKV